MNIPFNKEIYLEQIIDKTAVFEVVNEDDKIDYIMVDLGRDEDLVEGEYYSFNYEMKKIPTDWSLPMNDNEWVYDRIGRDKGILHIVPVLEVGITREKQREMAEKVRKARLKTALLNKMYVYIGGVKKEKLKWRKCFREKQCKTYNEDFAKYQKAVSKVASSGNGDDDVIIIKTKYGWRKYFLRVIKDNVSEGDFEVKSVIELSKLKVGIKGMSYALNRMDGSRYMIYKEGLFRVIKEIGGTDETFVNKTCSGIVSSNRLHDYKLYNDWLLDNINLMYEGAWGDENNDIIALAKFIDEFEFGEFLMENVI